MTRDEWVTLPGGERLRRASVWLYYEKPTALDWTFVEIAHGGIAQTLDCRIPIAEFEALLFGAAPAASDGYTRAAVRTAEGLAAWRLSTERGEPMEMNRPLQDAHAANVEAFMALYRERRGG